MNAAGRLVFLVQLPIPPPSASPEPVRGNVPLAAAYLKLFARRQGLEDQFRIELLPPALCNSLGNQGLVEELLGRQPWMVGFDLLPLEHPTDAVDRPSAQGAAAAVEGLAGRAGNHAR